MSFLEQATQAIHEAGGRMTPQRQLIVEILAAATERLDADALYQRARQRDDAISLATVYRTLAALESAGLIHQRYVSRDHERKVYEPDAEVYHFTCRRCRQVIPFQSPLVNLLKQELEQQFQVQALQACICVDGLCPACRQAENEGRARE